MRTSMLFLAIASASLSLFLFACTGSQSDAKTPHYNPPDDVVGTNAKCERLCDLQAKGQTLEQLCTDVTQKSHGVFAHETTCHAENPIGIWIDDKAAVHDAAFVDIETTEDGEQTRTVLLALSTDRGWEIAHEVAHVPASSGAIKLIAARAADVPGLQPYGVEIKLRVGDGGELVFVCGVSSNAVTCPVAVQTS
jgi:hypothetical protein